MSDLTSANSPTEPHRDDPTTTPTPAETRQDTRVVVDHGEAWEAVEANLFLSHEAKCEVHTILDNLAKPLAAVSAAAPDEREATCDPWLACPVHGTEHWREYVERARDDAARRVASHIRHGGSADLWPEPDGFTSPEPPEPTMPQGIAIAGGMVGREALADVLAESRRTGLGGMTERQFEGTQWVSAAVLRGLIDSTAWVTVRPGTVDQVAAILRVHYDHPDGEGSVECVCGGYEGPGDIFDHQAERVIAALGLTVADEGRAEDRIEREGGEE